MNSYSNFKTTVLLWSKLNKRLLPWRQNRTPFKVLVSEFLLQKTDAKKAAYVYPVLLENYPNVQALSIAEPQQLKKYIKGIGLSYRSERMIRTAQIIMKDHEGVVPNKLDALMDLPGVGRYIANAVLCFGFGYSAALIDTNTARILQRYWGVKPKTIRPREDKSLWKFAEKLVPSETAPEYNYALLDLGALVCRHRSPHCQICPLFESCYEVTN